MHWILTLFIVITAPLSHFFTHPAPAVVSTTTPAIIISNVATSVAAPAVINKKPIMQDEKETTQPEVEAVPEVTEETPVEEEEETVAPAEESAYMAPSATLPDGSVRDDYAGNAFAH